ncbi:hypothetical protein K7T73_12725 [Bacillus badius]|uniref:hypothetical protein n=1 Tax=Bacillus badius TaxID=1455 RepID=UPI001CC0B337|nr:hypothetical protein [Bacillus badius]UAT29464.1 hypothetical protein K7T73_12725 [Bacillus badius]
MCNQCRENGTVAYQTGPIMFFRGCPNEPEFHNLSPEQKAKKLAEKAIRDAVFHRRLTEAKRVAALKEVV